jgi:4-amino-4-deoxy-L-arabinose transferase-like glycosyltransferase
VVGAAASDPPPRGSAPAAWASPDARRLLLVTLAALVLFTYGLGAGTLWDQDEPKYFQIARELRWADPFELRLDGQPWFVHPPLFFWLQAATGRLIGFTEFAARFWSAVSGAAMVGATFLLARFFYGASTATVAAAISASMLQVLAQARLAVFDPTLAAFMLLALYMYLVGYATGSRRAHLWAWVWAGWATATKGPIGVALPAMAVVALWIVRRDWSAWREIPPLGPALFAAVGLPWYLVETARHGWPFLRTAVGYYLFNRFFGVVENQPGPWWYYVPVLVLGAMPWTAFAPPGIALLLRERRALASQALLLWSGITVAFYSLAGTKLPNYVLPVYPALAIGIARLVVEALERPGAVRGLVRQAAVLLPVPSALFIAGMLIYARMKFAAEAAALRAPLTIIAAIFAGGPLVAWALLLARRTRTAIVTLLVIPVVAVPVLVHQTLPAIETYRPVPRVARVIRAEAQAGDAVAAVKMPLASSLRFYAGRQVQWIEDRRTLRAALCGGRVFLVVPAAEASWVEPELPPASRVLADDAPLRLYLAATSVPCTRAPAPAR